MTPIVITVPEQQGPAVLRALALSGFTLRPVDTGPSQFPRHEVADVDPSRPDLLLDREWQVLLGIAAGRPNAQIGRSLGITEDTVKTHARRLYRKLGALDRAHAVHLAHQLGLLGGGR